MGTSGDVSAHRDEKGLGFPKHRPLLGSLYSKGMSIYIYIYTPILGELACGFCHAPVAIDRLIFQI